MSATRGLTTLDKRRVAIEALVDERSLVRYLGGKDVRPSVRERIEAALRRLGFADVVRAAVAS